MTHWVASEIVVTKDEKLRIQVIIRFIELIEVMIFFVLKTVINVFL
jgi:hypothetical protein